MSGVVGFSPLQMIALVTTGVIIAFILCIGISYIILRMKDVWRLIVNKNKDDAEL
jgi:hypothetical protein